MRLRLPAARAPRTVGTTPKQVLRSAAGTHRRAQSGTQLAYDKSFAKRSPKSRSKIAIIFAQISRNFRAHNSLRCTQAQLATFSKFSTTRSRWPLPSWVDVCARARVAQPSSEHAWAASMGGQSARAAPGGLCGVGGRRRVRGGRTVGSVKLAEGGVGSLCGARLMLSMTQ